MSEQDIDDLTQHMSVLCEGKDAGTVVGASLNMIQTCMTYGDAKFQRACCEALRAMAAAQLNVIGKPRQ